MSLFPRRPRDFHPFGFRVRTREGFPFEPEGVSLVFRWEIRSHVRHIAPRRGALRHERRTFVSQRGTSGHGDASGRLRGHVEPGKRSPGRRVLPRRPQRRLRSRHPLPWLSRSALLREGRALVRENSPAVLRAWQRIVRHEETAQRHVVPEHDEGAWVSKEGETSRRTDPNVS
eukprot:scaffold1019_cov338-Pavlova_lutheri.AAC.32